MSHFTKTCLISSPFFGAGLIMILIGVGVIPADPDSLHAPRWLLVVTGVPFLSVGFFLLSKTVKALSWFEDYVALFIFTSFSIIADWIAFGAGERKFETNTPLLEGDIVGRIVFGVSGVFLSVATVIGWYRMVKYWITGKKSW